MPIVATIRIDGNKFRNILKERGIDMIILGRNTGYSNSGISHAVCRGKISKPMWLAVSKELGIAIEDVAPDPEPIPVPEEIEVPEPIDTQGEDHSELLCSGQEEQYALKLIGDKFNELIDAVKSTRKIVDEETIAQGFNWGMEMFWSNHKKEIQDLILKNIKGAIFSGNLEALKKHDEILDERSPYREFIMPVENGRSER